MLLDWDQSLTGRLLLELDEMGHGDAVVIADAHFTASKPAKKRLADLPGQSSPPVPKAIRSAMVSDTHGPTLELMDCLDGLLPLQEELIEAAAGDAA